MPLDNEFNFQIRRRSERWTGKPKLSVIEDELYVGTMYVSLLTNLSDQKGNRIEILLARGELDIIREICNWGADNDDIASLRGRSFSTIRNQITTIFRKIETASRKQVASKEQMIAVLMEIGALSYPPDG